MMSKIGVFGGLFDPPHVGHLIIAQWVLEEFRLDRMIFVTAYNPPHKAKYSAFDARRRMVQLAIGSNRNFLSSDIEKTVSGKTYTVEVLRRLKQTLRRSFERIQLFLIIGADQWNEIEKWRSPEEIFRECRIIVVPRPGHSVDIKYLTGKKFLVSTSPFIGISSTMIRDRIRKGLSVESYVPPAVLSYIKGKKLYR